MDRAARVAGAGSPVLCCLGPGGSAAAAVRGKKRRSVHAESGRAVSTERRSKHGARRTLPIKYSTEQEWEREGGSRTPEFAAEESLWRLLIPRRAAVLRGESAAHAAPQEFGRPEGEREVAALPYPGHRSARRARRCLLSLIFRR